MRFVGVCAALVALSGVVQAQSLEGSWDLQGAGGVSGTVVFAQRDGARVMVTRLTGGESRPEAREDPARPGTFVYGPATGGAVAAVAGGGGGAEPLTVELVPQGGGFQGILRRGGAEVGRERLTRAAPAASGQKAALLAPVKPHSSNDANAFRSYARRLADYYRGQGWRADVLEVESAEALGKALEQAGTEGRPYARLVLIGHGGWDGPLFQGGQVSPTSSPDGFVRLIAALRRGTTADARVFSSTCHAGGSNRYEDVRKDDRWTDHLARAAARIVAGPMGPTSTEYTYQHVLAVLEGQGTTRQEVRWSAPEGARTIPAGGTLAGSPVRPYGGPAASLVLASSPAAPPAAPAVNLPLGQD
jgi:hypothetical protein